MNLPPASDYSMVSQTVKVKLKDGTVKFAYYGFNSKTWWEHLGDKGQEIKQPVVGWKPIN